MRRRVDKYLVYSSVAALFTEDFVFHYIIDLKLFYVIILLNTVLLAIKGKIFFNKTFLFIISFLIIHGFINVLLNNNQISTLISQTIGIIISSVYYYSFLKAYGEKIAVESYLQVAFFVALLAIPMFYLRINVFHEGNRLNGILTEPAHYTAIMLPATYLFLKQKKRLKFFLVLVTIILSKSSIGFIGLFLIILLPILKKKHFLKYFIATSVVSIFGVYYLYTNWDENVNSEHANFFIRRAKQTIESFSAARDGKFNQTINLSSYALISNIYVAKSSFLENPMGTGIGSYKLQYDKHYNLMKPPKYLIKLGLSKINRADANSLLLRVLTDLGVFGLFIIVFFTLKSTLVFRSNEAIAQQSVFFYLIVKLIREGHYFPPEFHFFLLIFLKKFNEDTAYT